MYGRASLRPLSLSHDAAALGVALPVGARAPVLGLDLGLDRGDVLAAARPRRLTTRLALDGRAHFDSTYEASTRENKTPVARRMKPLSHNQRYRLRFTQRLSASPVPHRT